MKLADLPFPITADELILPRGKTVDDLDWYWRLNDIDRLASSHDYHWPYPGHWGRPPGRAVGVGGACPTGETGGLCLARTLGGAQSGGRPLAGSAVLVCGVADPILGDEPAKVRVARAWVAAQVSWRRLILSSANLSYANLSYANLNSANLSYANLYSANLSYANLYSANLNSANLYSADLRIANLRYADLRYADLSYADLRYARANSSTAWPAGFTVPSTVVQS